MSNTYTIKKDAWIVSKPWYATVLTKDGFELEAGPFRTKRAANEQIDVWKDTERVFAK